MDRVDREGQGTPGAHKEAWTCGLTRPASECPKRNGGRAGYRLRVAIIG